MLHVNWDQVTTEQLKRDITRQMLNGQHSTLARIWLAKGAVVPRHQHLSEQFSMMVSGALKFIFDDREVVVNAGEILYIPPNVPHAAVALEDTVDLDFFGPRREDWVNGTDDYLRGKGD
jgi:quercetin dioxygenase-like cupin family protein